MFWDPFFQALGEQTGSAPDQIKLIAALIASYPLASIFIRIPANHPNWAHIFSLTISTIFLGPLLGLWRGYIELIAVSMVVYLIVAIVKSRNMPWIAFLFAMGHLTIMRTFNNVPTSTIEISAMEMVLVMKLTTFAWNVHDGRQRPERGTRLTKLPSPLAYLGYCFFFPTVLVGPAFEYRTYDDMVNHQLYDMPKFAPDGTPLRRRTPHGRRRTAYLHLCLGLFFLALFAILGARGDYARINSPSWWTWSHKTRFAFVQFCGFCARTKYYAVWSLSDGACILTGIGFNGYDPATGRTRWNRVRNIQITRIETAESYKVLLDSWNCRTNVWLRDNVYKRLAKPGQKPGSAQSMATFITSAFWHGIAPGYYLAFVTAGLLSYLGRQFRRLIRPYFLPAGSAGAAKDVPQWSHPALAKRAYDVVGWFNVQVTLNYLAAAFLLLDFKASVSAWTRCWWYGHVAIFATLGALHFGGRRWLKSGLYSRGRPGAPGVVPSVSVSPPTPQDDLLVTGRSSDVDAGAGGAPGLVRRRSFGAADGGAGDFGPAGVSADLAGRTGEAVEELEERAREAVKGRLPHDDGVEVLITEERVPEHGEAEGEGDDNADGEDTDLEWVRHDLQSVGDHGISPDDLLGDIMSEFETPTDTPRDTPRSGSPTLERQALANAHANAHAKSE